MKQKKITKQKCDNQKNEHTVGISFFLNPKMSKLPPSFLGWKRCVPGGLAFEFLIPNFSGFPRKLTGANSCLGIILAIFFILWDLSARRLPILSANTSGIPKIHFANQICEDSAPNHSFRTTKILLASMTLAGILSCTVTFWNTNLTIAGRWRGRGCSTELSVSSSPF